MTESRLDDPETSDADLVAAFQSGQAAAFDGLVARYRRPAWRIAWGILRNAEQADEAAQDAFVKAWQGLPGFRGDSSFKTWMYRIAMNAAHDLREREQSQGRTRARAEQEAASATATAARRGPRPLDAMIDEQQSAQVREALGRLPERQRLTLTLRLRDGLKYSEIAELIGSPVGTVKANVHHAVRNLRQALIDIGAVEAGGALDLDAASGES